MLGLLFIILIICFLSTIIIVGLFIQSFKKYSILHNESKHINEKNLFLVDIREKTINIILKLWDSIMYKRHWGVFIFYVVCLASCLFLFYRDSYPLLFEYYFNQSSKRFFTFPPILIHVLAVLPFITLFLAANADPGYISVTNIHSEINRYPYDRIIYVPRKKCVTCNLIKPARSKHCSLCNHCISKADHHCVWINNCVGLNNVRFFYAFLISNVTTLVIGAYLTHIILYHKVSEFMILHDLKYGQAGFLNYVAYISILKQSNSLRVTGILFILAFLIGFISFLFLLMHLFYVYHGSTSNEINKWSAVKYAIQDGTLFMFKHNSQYTSNSTSSSSSSSTSPQYSSSLHRQSNITQSSEMPHTSSDCLKPSIILQKISPDKYNRKLTDDEKLYITTNHLELQKINDIQEVTNIYDKGFWNNLYDIFFPVKTDNNEANCIYP